jgi:micrococcal nuclease
LRKILTILFIQISLLCFGNTVKVVRVIDGDTFEIESGEKVRMIGINTPEISDIYGKEAKYYLSNLILNKTVELKSDNISKNRDRYQRLLRYVILDGIDINKLMISDGYAFAYLKYRFAESNIYKQAQIKARAENKGIWGNSKDQGIVKKKEKKEISPKSYFIISLVIILLLIGFYSYYKN